MATAHAYPPSNEIKLGPAPARFALKFIEGKNLGDSKYPPFLPRVLFTCVDDRRIYLDTESASEMEHALVTLGIQPGEYILATKNRGGVRVERAAVGDPVRIPAQQAPQPRTSNMEALLERSVELARERGPAAFISPEPAVISPMAQQMCAAMAAAVDSIIETQAYAQRRGLGVTFSEESVRAIALTIFIQNAKGGR